MNETLKRWNFLTVEVSKLPKSLLEVSWQPLSQPTRVTLGTTNSPAQPAACLASPLATGPFTGAAPDQTWLSPDQNHHHLVQSVTAVCYQYTSVYAGDKGGKSERCHQVQKLWASTVMTRSTQYRKKQTKSKPKSIKVTSAVEKLC